MEMSMTPRNVKNSNLFCINRGQLRLCIYINCGLMTVHIVQGRHLYSPTGDDGCNAYVKVSLSPDVSRRTRCKTEVVTGSNHPTFDEKFSFELLEEDLRKRILISVWHRNTHTQHNEFLGCMSFGIQHIIGHRKEVDGWYYLLTEDVGKKKHLEMAAPVQSQLTQHHRHQEPIYASVAGSELTVAKMAPHHELVPIEHHVFVLKRACQGYGFSVTGCSPVTVSRVEPGSPAESVGVLRGDRIYRLNSISVEHSIADSVARIIKNSEKRIIMEVQRPTRPQPAGVECPPVWDETELLLLHKPAPLSSSTPDPALARHRRAATTTTTTTFASRPLSPVLEAGKENESSHRRTTVSRPQSPTSEGPQQAEHDLSVASTVQKVSVGICVNLPRLHRSKKTKVYGVT